MTDGSDAPPLQWPAYLTCVSSDDESPLTELLEEHGYDVRTVDGSEVHDGHAFQAALVDQLDLDDVFRSNNWDVFNDALHSAFRDTGPGPVALVWTHADHLVHDDPQSLLRLASILEGKALDDRRSGDRELTVFLLGDGPGYRRLADLLS